MEDPSKNVREQLAGEVRRQDDLREMEARHRHEMDEVRSSAESKLADVRAVHWNEMSAKESQRLDAVREADQATLVRQAEVQAAQATALANQVVATADAARAAVESQRVSTGETLNNTVGPLITRLDALVVANSAQQGERQAAVPLDQTLAPVIAEVRTLGIEVRELAKSQSENSGASAGKNQSRTDARTASEQMWRVITGFAVVLGALVSLYFATRGTATTTSPGVVDLPSCSAITHTGTACVTTR